MIKIEQVWADELKNVLCSVKQTYDIADRCGNCQKNDAVIKCKYCPHQYLCRNCDRDIHKLCPFHNRVSFAKDFFTSLVPTQTLNENNEIVNEGTCFKQLYLLLPGQAQSCLH